MTNPTRLPERSTIEPTAKMVGVAVAEYNRSRNFGDPPAVAMYGALRAARIASGAGDETESKRIDEALETVFDDLSRFETRVDAIRELVRIASGAGDAWPSGCRHPNSCSRNGRCGYLNCRWEHEPNLAEVMAGAQSNGMPK